MPEKVATTLRYAILFENIEQEAVQMRERLLETKEDGEVDRLFQYFVEVIRQDWEVLMNMVLEEEKQGIEIGRRKERIKLHGLLRGIVKILNIDPLVLHPVDTGEQG